MSATCRKRRIFEHVQADGTRWPAGMTEAASPESRRLRPVRNCGLTVRRHRTGARALPVFPVTRVRQGISRRQFTAETAGPEPCLGLIQLRSCLLLGIKGLVAPDAKVSCASGSGHSQVPSEHRSGASAACRPQAGGGRFMSERPGPGARLRIIARPTRYL